MMATRQWEISFPTAAASERALGYCNESRLERMHDAKGAALDHQRQVKHKLAWSLALSPAKSLPMNLFMCWMLGSQIHLMSIAMTGMLVYAPFNSLFSLGTAFAKIESEGMDFRLQKLAYIAANMLGMALAFWRLSSMGLIPSHASDWLEFLTPSPPAEISAGGFSAT